MRLTLATKSFSSRALLILLFASWSNSISVSLSPEEAKQFLSRPRRAYQMFEEIKQGDLERECVEERCSKEEAREVFENDPETEYFYPKYLACVEEFGDSEKKRQDLVTCVHNIPDQCSPSPCNPRGTVRCEDKKGDFFCHCFTGWIGARCAKFTRMQGAVGVRNRSALVCLGTGHHNAGHEGHEDNSADHAAKSLSMVRSANKGFTFNLYRQLAAQTDNQGKNVFFSPASVSLALAALSVGARGQTHQQLFSGLGFNSSLLSQVDVNQAFHGILTGVSKTLSEDISAGTAVFVDNKFKPQPEFLEALRQSYLAEGFSVDFNNSTESAATINKYVEGKTHGKIDQLVEGLDSATIMYLISYIYYKGKWLTPFDPAYTEKDLFNVDAQNQVPVQMMNTGLDRFDVYHDQQISTRVLRLPFNNSYSMLLMLPDGELTALEERICPMHYTKWLNGMKKGNYDVFLPKFSIKTKVNLSNVLRQMGITDMFGSAADLSGIAEGVAVSEVVHEATLDVDEAGATASAATGISTSRTVPPDPELKFNRPFMVLIGDSDNILFMGKIVNPNI